MHYLLHKYTLLLDQSLLADSGIAGNIPVINSEFSKHKY